MTRKLAVLGLPCGGGKAVLGVPAIPEGDERRRLLERYGELIDSLGGSYVTGPDVNTGEADMDVIGERTPYVFCRSAANGGSGDPSIHTALGVFHGIRASLRHAHRLGRARRATVLVQGAGLGRRQAGAAARRRRARPCSSATSTRSGRARPARRSSRWRPRSRPSATSTRRARSARR